MKSKNSQNAENTQHNILKTYTVSFPTISPANNENEFSMIWFAGQWMKDEVIGFQSENTILAKKRDLKIFFNWFVENNSTLDIKEWFPRDTAEFLRHLSSKGLSPSTVNRMLATLRRWCHWMEGLKETPFSGPIPTRRVKGLPLEEPTAKSLSTREINKLFKAADKLVAVNTRKNSKSRRNRAILGVAYYTGLRVSELCDLRLLQYDGLNLLNVMRKGNVRKSKIYIPKKCRELVDNYLNSEMPAHFITGIPEKPIAKKIQNSVFLFSLTPNRLNRSTIWNVIKKIAREASIHLEKEIKIHPHQLRHTFACQVRQRTGSDTETAALLGHTGIGNVGRYVRKTDKEREEILDEI